MTSPQLTSDQRARAAAEAAARVTETLRSREPGPGVPSATRSVRRQ